MADGYRIGVDIGGTFTDVVLLGADGTLRTKKVLSTPDDYARGVVRVSLELLDETGVRRPTSVDEVVHATTVASNTVLEGQARALRSLTTEGFRDVLELRRLRIPVMYELQYEKPPPLVPRRLRYEIPERLGPARRGVDRSWTRRPCAEVGGQARDAGVDGGRDQLPARLREPGPRAPRRGDRPRGRRRRASTSRCSSEILAEIREYERTSTAVVNAYVGPVVQRYIRSLDRALAEAGISAPLEIMQSSGGTDERRVRDPEAGAPGRVGACGAASSPAPSSRARPASERDLARHGRDDGEGARSSRTASRCKTSEYEVGAGINLEQPARSRAAATRSSSRSSTSRRSARAAAASSRSTSSGCCSVGPQSARRRSRAGLLRPGRRRADADGRASLVLGYLEPRVPRGRRGRDRCEMRAADAVESVARAARAAMRSRPPTASSSSPSPR